jgi:hypothetical protein
MDWLYHVKAQARARHVSTYRVPRLVYNCTQPCSSGIPRNRPATAGNTGFGSQMPFQSRWATRHERKQYEVNL